MPSKSNKINEKSMNEVSYFISKFVSEDNTLRVQELSRKLLTIINNQNSDLSMDVFRNLLVVALRYQNWNILLEMMDNPNLDTSTSDPVSNSKVIKNIKESLIY